MTIHLAIAFDENYLNPFYALVSSVFSNNRTNTIHIHCIATGISSDLQKEISQYVEREKGTIQFYSIEDARLHDLITMSTWTKAVYYRLYFPMLLQQSISRLLYMDTDTIVLKDLKTLYSSSLDGFPVGAVYDNYVRTQPLIGIEEENEYFNSGMLLIDLDVWRKEHVSENTIQYLMKFPERIKFVDQCGLNAVLYKRWKKLDRHFNLLYTYIKQDANQEERKRILENTTLLHFTLQRPWYMLCKNPFRSLYHDYLRKSPLFKGEPIVDFSFSKMPQWIYIRMVEAYQDTKWVKRMWRSLKGSNL